MKIGATFRLVLGACTSLSVALSSLVVAPISQATMGGSPGETATEGVGASGRALDSRVKKKPTHNKKKPSKNKAGGKRKPSKKKPGAKKKKPKLYTPVVKLARVGTQLKVGVGKRLAGKRQYRFTVQEHWQGKWINRGTYRTVGNGKKPRTRSLAVGCGATYRAVVHKTKAYRAATSRSFTFDPAPGQYSSDSDFIYYTPCNYEPTKRTYPAIVTYSPSGQSSAPGTYGELLRGIADKHGFIVMGYKHYKNNDPDLIFWYNQEGNPLVLGSLYERAKFAIDDATEKFPIQKSRIVLMGMSGGGSFSHALNIWYPGLAGAVVVNTGMIWGDAENGTYNGDDWWWYMRDFRTSADYANSRKQAIFFQSPTDFRYSNMLMNANLYRSKGWDVRQVNFPGGHVVAPKALYEQEFDRLVSSPAWR